MLYPHIEPYHQSILDVDQGHAVYFEECGTPDGRPIVVLHGGPGAGCSSHMRRLFNPRIFRTILLDQRGCGRSRPTGSVTANTTWHLIADIEAIRTHLGIEQWAVFGGSWGATLGLLYAQQHPDRVRSLVLRGIFLMTSAELDWFYGGGAGRFWPEAWEKFTAMIPPAERQDLIKAYHQRMFCGDDETEHRFGQAWMTWESQLASNERTDLIKTVPRAYARTIARIETHYFVHGGFLDPQTTILANMPTIAAIPGIIVQGRFDLLCPPHTAHALHRAWPASVLHITRAGHAMTETATTRMLIAALDSL